MTIIIRNLPPSVSEAELMALFEKYGTVQVDLSGSPVQVWLASEDPEAEAKAIAELNHTQVDGQPIELEWSDGLPENIPFPSPGPP
jgi:RNA recognition motif-containing protein